jgi:hypothetical protein
MESSNRDREDRLYASLHCRGKFASKVNSIARGASSKLLPFPSAPYPMIHFERVSILPRTVIRATDPQVRKQTDADWAFHLPSTLLDDAVPPPPTPLGRNWIPIDLLLCDEE